MEKFSTENLFIMLDKIQRVDSYEEILTRMFDEYVLDNSDNISLLKFNDHSMRTFNIDVPSWVDLFNLNEFPQLPKEAFTKYRDVYLFIKKLNNIYGYGLIKKDIQEREPFMLAGTNVNINLNEASHNIRFVRADEQFMNFQFKPELLMRTNIVMTEALYQSIANGIYNLNTQSIDHYLNVMSNMSNLLKGLKEEKKNE